ncbi:MFS transporter [Cellulomonas sp.]|uniref:MFS transporter n=1 Tax=Cellulomonas sp. TaxID=40001 RepID=UPI001B170E85|nr:MFS transporter [Cellulomonas sp.]MBO9553400.1 MFS transporter [Cellulomonas sp.]
MAQDAVDQINPLTDEIPSSTELPASIVTSGIPGHERPVPPYAIEPPTTPVSKRFVVTFAFAQLALFIALLGPVTISMAIKVTQVVGDAQATTAQGLILGVGAFAALIANPVFGRLSDRTMSRWGRRRPWMVGGALGLAAFLLVIALGTNVPTLLVGWFLAQLAANACFAAYLATIADQVPPSQTAKISALGGVMQNVGVLAAIWIAGMFTAQMVPLFMIPAAIGVVGMVAYALVLPDKQLPQRPPSMTVKAWLETFWISPRRHPDFAWAWISRFLLVLGSFMFSTFRFFWMKDHLGLTDAEAAGVVFKGVLIYTVVLVVVGQLAGIVSDKLALRKVFVFASTALFAVGLGLLTQVNGVGGFYLVEAILGAAFGIYMGVDLALVIGVLPNPDDAAKDLGVFNIANAGPQSLAPFLGALLIGGAAKNYDLLYLTAAALTLVGALAIIPVKKVK